MKQNLRLTAMLWPLLRLFALRLLRSTGPKSTSQHIYVGSIGRITNRLIGRSAGRLRDRSQTAAVTLAVSGRSARGHSAVFRQRTPNETAGIPHEGPTKMRSRLGADLPKGKPYMETCFRPPSLTLPSGPIPMCPAYTSVKSPKSGTLAKGKRLYSGRKGHREGNATEDGLLQRDTGGRLKPDSVLGANSELTRIALHALRPNQGSTESKPRPKEDQTELRRNLEESCVCTHAMAPARYGLGLALGAMATLFLTVMCLYAVQPVSAQEAGPAATAVTDIKPLQIGDTIPEALWHLPLQVVNHPEGITSFMLSKYKGKTILLDFLSTGCSGCIAAIPKLEAAQDNFGGDVYIIAITSQKENQVAAFIPKNKHTRNTRLPFVVEDKILKQHFPHQYISHVVWVDSKGIVRAFTGTKHVTTRTINELRSGVPLNWPVKTETTSFFNAPLVTLQTGSNVLPNNARRRFHYAVITGYTEGVGPHVATEQDSLMGIERVSFRNRTILDLYLIAVNRLYKLRPHQIVLDVAEPSAYTYSMADFSSVTTEQWYQRHAICYERTVPLGTSKSVQRKYMLADLNSLLNLNGRMEVRNGETCFVLSENDNTN
ncbi:TlpA family protein disulfide reductase [Parapedobacter deserti]|uniref:TlpA family protein disulfide reductase n=1 Tax=Parapedobacter deserti TaxID=1912957 RepID=A0ABV7JJ88_9SPHI